MNDWLDVVIVGGGIGGSTLAANLAQAGLGVELLERELEFVDRVRGEYIAPWGVAEAKKLGIYDKLMAAGGHHVTRMINYDELLTQAQAETNTLSLGNVHPDAAGPLCMEHVRMQSTLLQHAKACGAKVMRGVSEIAVQAGSTPSVTYTHEGARHARRCRIVVGADGRSSTVRRQLGLTLDENEVDHLMSGLLIEGAHDWPNDTQALGKAGEVVYFIFPQGSGRIRLYVDYDLADRGRYTGAHGARNLLRAFDAECLPGGRGIAEATPIGPCRAFPSQDAALNNPFVEGAILVGDSAGYTDPIWGQGLAITLRDVRLVRDLLIEHQRWSSTTFSTYGEERNERMRRVMCMTRFATTLFARFDENGIITRARAMSRMATRPELGALFMAGLAGPETLPPEVFTNEFYNAIFAP